MGGYFDGVLLLTAVVQGGSVQMLVVKAGQFLHLLFNAAHVVLDLNKRHHHSSADARLAPSCPQEDQRHTQCRAKPQPVCRLADV